jgi:hypothetical protein
MQVKGNVIKGWVGIPSTPTMEVKEGLVGPQNSSKAEKVAPVSRRREIGLPSIMAIILGSHEVMVVGPGSPGLCQSSATVTSPKRSVREEGQCGGLRPSALRGGGAVHSPVALLFALKTWPWWASWFRTSTGPVSLKATPKTWARRCLGFFLASGVRGRRLLSEGLCQHLEFSLISPLLISPLLFKISACGV